MFRSRIMVTIPPKPHTFPGSQDRPHSTQCVLHAITIWMLVPVTKLGKYYITTSLFLEWFWEWPIGHQDAVFNKYIRRPRHGRQQDWGFHKIYSLGNIIYIYLNLCWVQGYFVTFFKSVYNKFTVSGKVKGNCYFLLYYAIYCRPFLNP